MKQMTQMISGNDVMCFESELQKVGATIIEISASKWREHRRHKVPLDRYEVCNNTVRVAR